ncbi:hypothetical protein E2562_002084 [Oryza meyeriana var. granulata]|uniref:Peptidase A1 domain-containing protein n=1 Tax=Oryza meyeriana var. granulata TaxID=110450 RepID=A0A6G1EEJ0_9ORYZ|nr:hypothetical protein E2562_002084 [Oryza meyeriana var. granulata]
MLAVSPTKRPFKGPRVGVGPTGAISRGGSNGAPATTFDTYVISLNVGTPPQSVSGSLDVGSELAWVPCSACDTNIACNQARQAGFYLTRSSESFREQSCRSTNCLNFYPHDAQSCIADETCDYTYSYGGANGKKTSGTLSTEEFTFWSTKINVSFGCAFQNQGDFRGQPGIIGLNRGRYSLVTQLQLGRFSYYFAPEDHAGDSVFRFADDAVPQTNSPRYTQFLTSGAASRKPHGRMKQALISTVGPGSPALGLDMCYMGGKVFPAMALVFAGGAVMQLRPRNFLYSDTRTGLLCLTILPSQDVGGSSLLGSQIQTGTHMIYDIQGSRLGFESFDQPSKSSNRPSSAAAPPRTSTAVTIACFVWCVVACMFTGPLLDGWVEIHMLVE